MTTKSALSGARCADVTGVGVPEHHGDDPALPMLVQSDNLSLEIWSSGGCRLITSKRQGLCPVCKYDWLEGKNEMADFAFIVGNARGIGPDFRKPFFLAVGAGAIHADNSTRQEFYLESRNDVEGRNP